MKSRRYHVYASVSKPPGEDKLRSSLIVIVDDRGGLVDYDQNHNIGWYQGRLSKENVKIVVKDFIRTSFGIKVRPEDIAIVKYAEARNYLLQLENK